MTHPIQATILGSHGMAISYTHFYFHHGQALLTHAYATSTTATAVGDGGSLQGSTELDDESGHNYQMTNEVFQAFTHLVLGLNSTNESMGTTGSEEHKQRDHFFVNMLLADYTTITNLHPVNHNKSADNQQALTHALARYSLLLLGSDALITLIFQQMWGANDTIWKTLGAPCRDLALIW